VISTDRLRRTPVFAAIGESQLRDLAMICDVEYFPSGAVIFREGDRADKMYLLVDGEVDIQYALGNGELRTVDTLVPGELMMWSALVEPFQSTGVGVARKASSAIAIDAARLRGICAEDLDLGHQLLVGVTKLLASRLQGARVQLAASD